MKLLRHMGLLIDSGERVVAQDLLFFFFFFFFFVVVVCVGGRGGGGRGVLLVCVCGSRAGDERHVFIHRFYYLLTIYFFSLIKPEEQRKRDRNIF